MLKALVNPENPYKDILIGKFGVYADFRFVEYRIPGNRRKRSALVDFHLHPDPHKSLSCLYDQEVDLVGTVPINRSSVTYLEPPFEEAVPILPTVVGQVPKLVVETNLIVSSTVEPGPSELTCSTGFPSIEAGYYTILDWVTDGGIPEESDHAEAIAIWLSNSVKRSRAPCCA